jgi:hypothetical protein
MRILTLTPIATFAVLVSCSGARIPSNANFTVAINQYLATHGKVCTLIGSVFPVDIPRSAHGDRSDIGAKMATLERAGLVSETDTMAVVHGMLDALRGPSPPQPVHRYQVTAEGQKILEQIPGVIGPVAEFCYGRKAVDKIVNWTKPEAGSPQAEVTYTYKIQNLADWAQRADVQQAFPDIRTMLNGASNTNQVIGVELTNAGWQVPGA